MKKSPHAVLYCCIAGLSGTALLALFAANQHVALIIATALFTGGAIASLSSVSKQPANTAVRDPMPAKLEPHAQKPAKPAPDAPDALAKTGLWKRTCLEMAEEFSLTPRETEILELLLKAQTIKRISETLVISEHTTKTHVYNMYKKIGISTRSELSDSFETRLAGLKRLR